MSQRSRRVDPYPWTWEIPVGIVTTFLLTLALGVQVGRAVANRLAGADWAFPPRTQLFSSLPGILAGDAAAGLPVPSEQLADPTALWVWVVISELVLVAACVIGLKVGLGRWGPGRMKGMASRSEAERLLGRTRLRKNRAVIRPDLHQKERP